MNKRVIKKAASLLVAIMLLSSVMLMHSWALAPVPVADSELVFTLNAFGGLDADGNIDIGANPGDNTFMVAVEVDSLVNFSLLSFDIAWDTGALNLVSFSIRNDDYTGDIADYEYLDDNTSIMFFPDTTTQGVLKYLIICDENWTDGTDDFLSGAVLFLEFEPVNDTADNTQISIYNGDVTRYDESYDAIRVPYAVKSTLIVKLNGGLAISTVTTLGAKVNDTLGAMRFGAEYNKNGATVTEVGMLLCPTSVLGTDTLDLDYYAANVNGGFVILLKNIGISGDDFEPGKLFEDYDNFVFYATLTNIPATDKALDITFVPFIAYDDGTVEYGAEMTRSYDGLLNP